MDLQKDLGIESQSTYKGKQTKNTNVATNVG
jgi:hypothetical protein